MTNSNITPPVKYTNFQPLIERFFDSGVGFDSFFKRAAEIFPSAAFDSYPPYNIVRNKSNKNKFVIELSAAGFSENELSLSYDENSNVLTVEGESKQIDADQEFLHRGLARRNFQRRFLLADFIEINNVILENGTLSIHLERKAEEKNKSSVRHLKIDTPNSQNIETSKS